MSFFVVEVGELLINRGLSEQLTDNGGRRPLWNYESL